ncbi:hypothetical protein [Aeromonas salmonicida]|uniref:hypothetical protein n=1 Tax=Aeromonas salmonicida TaxID=645 RepID=UPI00232BB2E8|nr:hypothetical protein [Aeromonas salmonicida]WCH25231.1 hypothetical protein ONZ54_22925 [Aeromonas salmonicida]
MAEWVSVWDEMPPPEVPILCQLKHCFTGSVREFELIHVEEDDCSWRTADDRSEVSHSWDVITWQRGGQG